MNISRFNRASQLWKSLLKIFFKPKISREAKRFLHTSAVWLHLTDKPKERHLCLVKPKKLAKANEAHFGEECSVCHVSTAVEEEQAA